MGLYYSEVVQRSLCYAQGRYMCQIFLPWVMLLSWLTFTAAQASAATTPQPCGGTLIGSGTIRSPYYPLKYPDNVRCSWRLWSISNDTSIRIQFNFFALENNYDYITITDERNNSKRYTGNVKPPTTLAGKEARIEFYSDESIAVLGFAASFSSINVTSRFQCETSDAFWCTTSEKCISSNWLCDGYTDCTFNEDELSCPSTAPTTTRSLQNECLWLDKFWCSMSVQCVPKSYKCNNNKDCVYGEDEDSCTKTTTSSESVCKNFGFFWCSLSEKCISMSYKCDHFNDCAFGEDEVNCPTLQQQCEQSNQFWCGSSRKCIRFSSICDEFNDCSYGDDEDGCPHMSTATRTAIVAGSVCGVVLLILLVITSMLTKAPQRLRQATPTSNTSLQSTVRPSDTVCSTTATYAGQIGTHERQDGDPQGTGGLPLDQHAPPSYEAIVKACATGAYVNPAAQSGEVHSSSNTAAVTSASTN